MVEVGFDCQGGSGKEVIERNRKLHLQAHRTGLVRMFAFVGSIVGSVLRLSFLPKSARLLCKIGNNVMGV